MLSEATALAPARFKTRWDASAGALSSLLLSATPRWLRWRLSGR